MPAASAGCGSRRSGLARRNARAHLWPNVRKRRAKSFPPPLLSDRFATDEESAAPSSRARGRAIHFCARPDEAIFRSNGVALKVCERKEGGALENLSIRFSRA